MTALEGIRMGMPPSVPKVQKKRPAPYARPSVTIGGAPAEAQVKREWRSVQAHEVAAGDIVPDLGLVLQVDEQHSAPAANSGLSWQEIADAVVWTVRITAVGGVRLYQGNELVFAFTAKP